MANKHLSYNEFSNIFGDLGITEWMKYNYLNNALPDGIYNGITKRTITSVSSINTVDIGTRAFHTGCNFINPANTNTVWQFGFSDWKITTAAKTTKNTDRQIAIQDSIIIVNIPGLTTIQEYNAYLKEHPIVIYYYDSRIWDGAVVDGLKGVANCFYLDDSNLPVNSSVTDPQVRDVQGKYHWYGNMGETIDYKNDSHDLMIGAGNGLQQNRINIKDNVYPLTQKGLNEINKVELPRAIVWTK